MCYKSTFPPFRSKMFKKLFRVWADVASKVAFQKPLQRNNEKGRRRFDCSKRLFVRFEKRRSSRFPSVKLVCWARRRNAAPHLPVRDAANTSWESESLLPMQTKVSRREEQQFDWHESWISHTKRTAEKAIDSRREGALEMTSLGSRSLLFTKMTKT